MLYDITVIFPVEFLQFMGREMIGESSTSVLEL
jgi:hypothetical protein